jgi:creatinine amidohydrolase
MTDDTVRERVLMEELTWPEYAERIRTGAPILIACGATEQHGPHLPLGTDTMQAQAIAIEVARAVGGIVAPPLTYGYKSQPKSGGGQSFPGTTSLDGMTLTCIVRDILKEFVRHGARRLILMNGHYENTMFLVEGIDLAIREAKHDDVRALLFQWWDLVSEQTIDRIFEGNFPGWAQEHAAVIETSLVAVIRPDLVRWERAAADQADRILPYEVFPATRDMIARSGSLSSPKGASMDKGKPVIDEVVREIVRGVRREFSGSGTEVAP